MWASLLFWVSILTVLFIFAKWKYTHTVSHTVKTQRLLQWMTSQCKRHHYWKYHSTFRFFRICCHFIPGIYFKHKFDSLNTDSMSFQYLMDQSRVFDGVLMRWNSYLTWAHTSLMKRIGSSWTCKYIFISHIKVSNICH